MYEVAGLRVLWRREFVGLPIWNTGFCASDSLLVTFNAGPTLEEEWNVWNVKDGSLLHTWNFGPSTHWTSISTLYPIIAIVPRNGRLQLRHIRTGSSSARVLGGWTSRVHARLTLYRCREQRPWFTDDLGFRPATRNSPGCRPFKLSPAGQEGRYVQSAHLMPEAST